MKILNLVNQDNSDIKYRISKFPDGQQQVWIRPGDINEHKIVVTGVGLRFVQPIQIKARLNNFLDLELIICTVASLRCLGVKEIHLYVPYFLGSRSDRKFEDGSNNYLKDVICPIVNSLNFESVTVLDPHSDVLEACLNNFKKDSNAKLVDFAFRELTEQVAGAANNYVLISPDAGASKKIYKVAEEIGYRGDIITCSKDRDGDGNLTKCIVPLTEDHDKKSIIIIDDICDGGATFINIAKKVKEYYSQDYLDGHKGIYLIVTHGIFSKGFEELEQYFDGIYCTNSYKDIDEDNTEWVYTEEYENFVLNKVKQLNVF